MLPAECHECSFLDIYEGHIFCEKEWDCGVYRAFNEKYEKYLQIDELVVDNLEKNMLYYKYKIKN